MLYRGTIFRIRSDRYLLVRLLTEATIDARLEDNETLVAERWWWRGRAAWSGGAVFNLSIATWSQIEDWHDAYYLVFACALTQPAR